MKRYIRFLAVADLCLPRPAAILMLLMAPAQSLSASKCGGHIIYDLELESVTPTSAPFPQSANNGWPPEWPVSATFESAGRANGLSFVVDDDHVLVGH